jgi:Serine dehydrogenase proteinase
LDETIFATVNASEEKIERKLECNLLYFYGELRSGIVNLFRNFIESLANHRSKRDILSICLTTSGGEAETVEKMVNIIRHHYDKVYFIVPSVAYSAGTIFCMSGDKIYMDYSSALGPIDPQVPDKEDNYLVPALGYLDKFAELVEKSKNNTISPGEIAILVRQDLAMLRFYEQARDLSIALLKEWLTKYKFKAWTHHRTTNPGKPVTAQEKEERAEEIAKTLSNNNIWHSHGRSININALRTILHLEIDDYGEDKDLSKQIRLYSDTLTDYLRRQGFYPFIYNRRVYP